MEDYSNFSTQNDSAFAGDPFAEMPFEPVPFEESATTPVVANTTVQAEPVQAVGQTAVAAAAAVSTAKEEPGATAEEKRRRAEHEASEAKRKAEFDAKQEEKKKAYAQQLALLKSMTDEEALNAAIQRTATDTEKLTRRNMKELVTEYIQTLCCEDPAFARLVMHPQKNMVRCFQYINRRAYDYVQDEMKANGIKPGTGVQMYASDVPDDVCYHWAEEYFRTPNVKEDLDKEEKFMPKPYSGTTSSKSAKKTEKKSKKEEPQPIGAKKPVLTAEEKAAETGQMSIFGVAV